MPASAKPPTLQDIATEVGVTASTVSAVLNDTAKAARFSEATKAQIRECAKRLGYTANPLAQALRGQPPNLLGFISFNVESIYYGNVLNAIEVAAQARQYQVVVANMQRQRERLESCLELMLRWRVRGILLASVGNAIGEPLRRVLEKLPVPIVNLGNPEPAAPLPSINFDNIAAGAAIAEHLISLGHRRVCLLCGSTQLGYFAERVRGFQQSFGQVEGGEVHVVEVAPPGDFAAAHAATLEMLRRGGRLTALAGANDTLAIGGLRALLDAGVEVPAQVSVVGIDDVPISSGGGEGGRIAGFLKPSLTTVRVPVGEIAAAGVVRLLELVGNSDEKLREEPLLLPPQLIVRESSAPAPTH